MNKRAAQIQDILRQKDIDCALFIVEENIEPTITLVTNLTRVTHAALLVQKEAPATAYVSALDHGRALKESAVNVILLKKRLFEYVKEVSPKTIGIDFENVSHHLLERLKQACPRAKIFNISDDLKQIRIVKTEEEIEKITKAAAIANNAFTKALESFTYKTESELKAAIEYEMAMRGASPSFPTIVASGKNASVPHHFTTNSSLQEGFCVIDFGANLNGFCSDCTRTIYIGKPSEKERQVYKFVRESQEAAIAKLKPGIRCAELDTIYRNRLGKYKKYFTHSLGHGIGVEVHEFPSVSSKSPDIIQKNTAVTIEPGIYIPDKFGIRIEDLFIVRTKASCITNLPKDLIIFDRSG